MHPMYKKLAAMSGMAVGFLSVQTAAGQVLFHDIIPDTEVELDGDDPVIPVDVDMDGLTDLYYYGSYWSWCYVCGESWNFWIEPTEETIIGGALVPADTCVMFSWTEYEDSFYGVANLMEGFPIPGSLNWSENPSDLFYAASSSYGAFCSNGMTGDGYVPVQLIKPDGMHYGWVRLIASLGGGIEGHGYIQLLETAYQTGTDESLNTGLEYLSDAFEPARSLDHELVSLDGIPTDLVLLADRCTNEELINRYRIFILPFSETYSYTTDMLLSLDASLYTEWIPNGLDLYIPLSEDQVDINGDLMLPDTDYRFVILHLHTDGAPHFLSDYSPAFRFTSTVYAASNAHVDFDCEPDGVYNLSVSFDAAENEIGISEYRIMLGKSAEVGGEPVFPTVEELLDIPADDYISIVPDGSSMYTVLLPDGTGDLEGIELASDTLYNTYLVSVPVAGFAEPNYSILEDIVLGHQTHAVSDIVADDIGRSGLASDIYYSFNHPESEAGISKYRIFLVAESGPIPTLGDLTSAPVGTYKNVSVSDDSSSGTLTYDLTWDGTPLADDTDYYLEVVSFSSGMDCTYSTSEVSPVFSFRNPASQAMITSAFDDGETGVPMDINVSFDHGTDDLHIAEYQVFLYNAVFAGINLEEADAMSPDQYKVVDLAGTSSTISLPDFLLDYQHHPVTPDVSYRVYVLSKGLPGYESTLSDAFSSVSFDPALVEDVALSDPGISDNITDVQVSFTPLAYESTLDEYRIFLVPVADTASFDAETASWLSEEYYISAPTGETLVQANAYFGLKDFHGNEIENGADYVATVIAYDGSMEEYFLSPYSNLLTITGIKGEAPDTRLSAFIDQKNLVLHGLIPHANDRIIFRDMANREISVSFRQNADEYRIELGQIPAGVYLVELHRDGSTYVCKVVIP